MNEIFLEKGGKIEQYAKNFTTFFTTLELAIFYYFKSKSTTNIIILLTTINCRINKRKVFTNFVYIDFLKKQLYVDHVN